MKIFLQRVKQAGASSSRVAGVIIILAFLILTALFAARVPTFIKSSAQTAKPAIANPSTSCTTATFTGSFIGNQIADAQTKQDWTNFLASLNPTAYETITISGTFDPIGRILSDPTIVPQIATAMKNGTSFSWQVGAVTW